MKTRNINEVVEKLQAMSAEVDTLSQKLNELLSNGGYNTDEYEQLSNSMYMNCGAVQALQWVLEQRNELKFNNN